MKHDDDSVGRILTRREALAALGVGGGALAVGRWALGPGPEAGSIAQELQMARTLPACVVRPEQTEGPCFVDTKLERGDILICESEIKYAGYMAQSVESVSLGPPGADYECLFDASLSCFEMLIDAIRPGVRNWSPRQAMRASDTATMTAKKPRTAGPMPDSVKEWTDASTPERVRKVPRIVSENVATTRDRFQTRSIPRRSCTITECR